MQETLPRIYLASSSPRRSELLRQIGVDFEVLAFRSIRRGRDTDVDETPLPDEIPERYVERMAINKVYAGVRRQLWRKLPCLPVLAADTIIDVDGCIIGKPANTNDACEILKRISGRCHRVLTAVALSDGKCTNTCLSVSDVRFRPLTEDDICRYVATGEPMDKAGAYAIQGRAAAFVMEIRGSYSGIMGLPLFETASLLEAFDCQYEPVEA